MGEGGGFGARGRHGRGGVQHAWPGRGGRRSQTTAPDSGLNPRTEGRRALNRWVLNPVLPAASPPVTEP